MSRSEWSSSHTQIPRYSSLPGSGPAVTKDDFSYITSQDLDYPILNGPETCFDVAFRSRATGEQIQSHPGSDPCSIDIRLPAVPEIDDPRANEDNPPRPFHRLRAAKHYSIPSLINGVPAEAYCATGSDVNLMSEMFVSRNGFKLDRSNTSNIWLLSALVTRAVGTTRTKFRFRDEEGYHDVLFYVFARCPDDVILGNSFIKQTDTLQNNNKHRIKESYRLCLLSGDHLFFISATYSGCHGESAKRLLPNYVYGRSCNTLQNSDPDLVVISGSYAHSCKFQFDATSQTEVTLGDGSIIMTDGMVWDAEVEFASTIGLDLDSYLHNVESLKSWLSSDKKGVVTQDLTQSTVICDLHVVDSLLCDVTLNTQLLVDIGLSQQPIERQLPPSGRWSRNISNLRGYEDKLRARLKNRISDRKGKTPNDSTSQVNFKQLVSNHFEQEIVMRDAEDRTIRMTPPEHKHAAVDAALERRSQWEDSQRRAERLERSFSKSNATQGSSDSTAT